MEIAYLYLIGLLVIAYILGSIPSAVWIGKSFYGIDVREHGSGNAGTTNTFRVLGKKAGSFVFLIDVSKGVLAVSLVYFIIDNLPIWGDFVTYQILAGVFAVMGHIFPVFANFKGGKGVATMLGIGIGILPLAALICFGAFIIILIISKYVSLGSISAGILFAIQGWFIFDTGLSMRIFVSVTAVLLIITHIKNIKRLLAGNERKTYLLGKPKQE